MDENLAKEIQGNFQSTDCTDCESVIKWQTGEPKEDGQYLVTTSLGFVSTDVWLKDAKRWYEYSEDYFDVVIAWCKLSDIEPYKE